MATQNCAACDELKKDAPNLIVNGLGDTECTSLKNNTGLSPSNENDDCTDLENLNDCLVGNMESEVDAYEVCDWKPFMKRFIPNVWTVFKGIICTICGVWANIDNIKEQILALCELINTAISPSGNIAGVFPRRTNDFYACGRIVNKNNRPALIDGHSDAHNADQYTGVGFRFGKIKGLNCMDGSIINRWWYKPYIWGYELNKDIKQGDALWVISKSDFQRITGASDAWWQLYTDESWTWTQHRITQGADRGKNIWLRWKVGESGYDNNTLVMQYYGTSYPNTPPDYDAWINEGDTTEIRWA